MSVLIHLTSSGGRRLQIMVLDLMIDLAGSMTAMISVQAGHSLTRRVA